MQKAEFKGMRNNGALTNHNLPTKSPAPDTWSQLCLPVQ